MLPIHQGNEVLATDWPEEQTAFLNSCVSMWRVYKSILPKVYEVLQLERNRRFSTASKREQWSTWNT